MVESINKERFVISLDTKIMKLQKFSFSNTPTIFFFESFTAFSSLPDPRLQFLVFVYSSNPCPYSPVISIFPLQIVDGLPLFLFPRDCRSNTFLAIYCLLSQTSLFYSNIVYCTYIIFRISSIRSLFQCSDFLLTTFK